MRLLNTTTLELSNDSASPATHDYAILSHRWQQPGEITFKELSGNPNLLKDRSLQTPQAEKVRQACARARQREKPLDWIWIDTCCIDKSNAVEEGRSINSMFEWYQKAQMCITYFHDVDSFPTDQTKAEWFGRGWTLQELVASYDIEFYGRSWNHLGTKHDLAERLEQVTRIDRKILVGETSVRSASVAARLSWMAGRKTTMVEDIAYSMLGILGVYMAPQYGEGVNAFFRLQKTLMETSTDESIFAWATPEDGKLHCYGDARRPGREPQWAPKEWGLVAPSPDCFKKSGDIVVIPEKVVPRPHGGYRWTQQGVLFQLPAKAGAELTNMLGLRRKEIQLPLNCWKLESQGKVSTSQVKLVKKGDGYVRAQCSELLQKEGAKVSSNRSMGQDLPISLPMTVLQPKFEM